MADATAYENVTEMQFDSYIKVALDNEFNQFFRKMGEEIENQLLFNELDDGQMESFMDPHAQKAFDDMGTEFKFMQYTVEVCDEQLYDALSRLDERSRTVILMRHWLEMSDQEISDETGIKRRTVNDIRASATKDLKEILGRDGYDANGFFSKHKI